MSSNEAEHPVAGSETNEDTTLYELNELQSFLLEFRDVSRVTPIPGTESQERENDVEHSYFLAMAGWHVSEKLQLPLDHEKILKYSLVHDIPEVYAGDVDAFASPQKRETKKFREAEAIQTIETRYGHIFPGMLDELKAYERQEDLESQFVKALDKLMPALMITMDRGRSWQEEGVTQQQLIENKLRTTSISEPVSQICHALVEFLKTKPEYFPDEQSD